MYNSSLPAAWLPLLLLLPALPDVEKHLLMRGYEAVCIRTYYVQLYYIGTIAYTYARHISLFFPSLELVVVFFSLYYYFVVVAIVGINEMLPLSSSLSLKRE